MTKRVFLTLLSALFLMGGMPTASACPGMAKDGVKCTKCAESEKKPCAKCKEGKKICAKCAEAKAKKEPCKICKESERRSKNGGIFFNE